MSKFGRTLFSGSRFIFWALAPVLLLCAALLPFLVSEWTAARVIFVSLVEMFLFSLILGLYDPLRFRWATRCVTGVVFCAYLAYVIDEAFLSGKSAEGAYGGRAGLSPWKAIAGFIAIGLPCLWYTMFGRFSLRDEGRQTGGEPEASDKVDAIDIDI
ncbi:MAG TPA: hypothetical protein VF591_20205 [Pyrinomonadaceae bacterium]|jgi:hypothetical protein